jgi:uncharacterized protein (TIGR02246 family)
MADPTTVEARLRRLEDLEEIRELFLRYQRCLDAKDFAGYAGLFAEDGVFVAGALEARGPAAIEELVRGMLGSLLTESSGDDAHLVVNPSVTVDGDRATAAVTWVYVVRSAEDEPRLAKLGHYDDVLARTAAGWRFLRREAPTDMPRPAAP